VGTTTPAERLVTIAHGTRHGPGNAVAREVTAEAATRLAMPAVASYVELCEPLWADVVAASDTPTVAVPLLLSTGFHVREDIPGAEAAGPLVIAPPLGPHPLLAAAQVARLRECGAAPGQPVALVAAGSRDPLAAADLEEAVRLLAEAWGGPVALATLTGPGPRPDEVLTPGTAVSPYLLSEGFFADRCRAAAADAGALVADVIGPHPLVVDLVVDRARAAQAGQTRSKRS